MEKEIKINCPEGFKIDEENSTFNCIKLKPIKKELPRTWEEFCETHPRKANEVCFSHYGVGSIDVTAGFERNKLYDKALLPSKELAEAMLALCQLIQLRDCYNDGWVPNWTDDYVDKYVIRSYKNVLQKGISWVFSRVLVFKTEELRDQFLNNFEDLIEKARPLL